MQVIYKERKNTDCAKWDALEKVFGSSDLLPLWVADMDFEVPKCVKKALAESVEQGTFGYYHPPKAYYDAFIRWEEMRHTYQVALGVFLVLKVIKSLQQMMQETLITAMSMVQTTFAFKRTLWDFG